MEKISSEPEPRSILDDARWLLYRHFRNKHLFGSQRTVLRVIQREFGFSTDRSVLSGILERYEPLGEKFLI